MSSVGRQLVSVIDELTRFIENHDVGPRLKQLSEAAHDDPDGFLVAQTRWPYDELTISEEEYTAAIVLHGRVVALASRAQIPADLVPNLPISHFGSFKVLADDERIDIAREVVIPPRVIAERNVHAPFVDAGVVIGPNAVTWRMKMKLLRAAAVDFLAVSERGDGNRIESTGSKQRWLKVTEAATASDVHPGVITRAVDAGELASNGKTGVARRVDAIDLTRWQLKRAGRTEQSESTKAVERKTKKHVPDFKS